MKVYKVTLMIVDHDDLGEGEIKDVIENVHYPNHCMNPEVVAIESRDIGEWRDDHPLNQRDQAAAEFDRLFADDDR